MAHTPEQRRAYYQLNREAILAKKKLYRNAHKDDIRAYDKKRYADNPERSAMWHKKFAEDHPNYWKENGRKRMRLHKMRLVILHGGRCCDCQMDLIAFPECADFDHLYDKTFQISAQMMRRFDVLAEETKKCDLVCANCHRKRTKNRSQELMKAGTPDALK